MTQKERLARREALRVEIAKCESALAELREEEKRLLDGCEHTYENGRPAATGGQMKICAICGRVLPRRDEKLWG